MKIDLTKEEARELSRVLQCVGQGDFHGLKCVNRSDMLNVYNRIVAAYCEAMDAPFHILFDTTSNQRVDKPCP